MGLRVVVLDGSPDAPGLRLGDANHVVDILDPTACVAIAKRERVDGVIHICSEVSMFPMAAINEAMGLHGIDLGTAERATNKEKMRRAFADGGAPSPCSHGAATESEAVAAIKLVGWPLIVKPSRNSGSRGVTKVEKSEGLDCFLRAFQRAVELSFDHSAVIESFVDGPEFSVELLIWDRKARVLALTDKLTTGEPHFIEIGHSQPSSAILSERLAIEAAAIKGVRALGLDWCAAHAEVRLSAHGPVLMEIGARLGGDYITTELVPRSTGIDMVEGAIRLALGEVPDLSPRHPPKGAAIRYLTPKSGKVVCISGIETARRMAGVQIVALDWTVGDLIPKCDSSRARVGHVIAEANTAEEAIAIANTARENIRIVTDMAAE
jgi:biotin carboxylase